MAPGAYWTTLLPESRFMLWSPSLWEMRLTRLSMHLQLQYSAALSDLHGSGCCNSAVHGV